MKNSALRENILLQTADYKCKKQDEIMKRYIFRSKKEGEENTPLPYTLLTKKVSSEYFKRKMNQQVKLSILNCEYMGIDTADILYRIKNFNTSGRNAIDHYPFDTKFDILGFFDITNKFVNIYQILSDGSLKKINPTRTYTYNGQQVGSTITIEGTNCISIEFYDDGKAVDYMIEILGCVISYNILSYNDFKERYFTTVNGSSIYNESNTIITFVDGLLVEPSRITKDSTSIEVYTLKDGSILHYGRTKIVDNKIDLGYESSYISGKLVIPYAYIDSDDNLIYKQFPNSVENCSEYIPNSFRLINYDTWLNYEPKSTSESEYDTNNYYIDSDGKIYEYSDTYDSLIEVGYASLADGVYYISSIDELWEYNNNTWNILIPDSNTLYINTSTSNIMKFDTKNKCSIIDSNMIDMQYIDSNELYLDRYNSIFWTYNNEWTEIEPQDDVYYIENGSDRIFMHNDNGVVTTNPCVTNDYFYEVISDNVHYIYEYSEKSNEIIQSNFEDIIRYRFCLKSDNSSLWRFKESQSAWIKCDLTVLSTEEELNSVTEPNGFYYIESTDCLYAHTATEWKKITFFKMTKDTIYFDWLYDNLWKFSYDDNTWNEYPINNDYVYVNVESDSSLTLFKFNSEEERWYRFIPTNVSDGLVYHVKDSIYYRFTFDNQWEPINVVNIILIEFEMYFDTNTNQIWRYNNANWSLLNNNNYYIDTNMDNIWKYNNDTNQWDTSKPVKISSISSNKVYFDQDNNSIWKYNDSFYIHTLILGDRSTSLKSDHYALYDELMMYYANDTDAVEYVLNQTLGNEDEDTKLLLTYPYYYREILEKKVKDNLYIKTLRYIKKSQIIYKNGLPYVKFMLPIRSFSFMLFLNGKLLEPDMYEENKLDMSIYILASKILDLSEVYREVPADVNNHDSLSNYKHKELSKFRHEYLEREGYEFYYHNPNEMELLSPLTIVRAKSFFSEANRYPLIASPVYLNKNDYIRYTFDPNLMYYTEKTNGRYIKYNERYYMISNYEYIYDDENKKFIKTDNVDGDYYKIITNKIKVPYNKHLEENLYNLIFVKELNENNSKVLEDVFFDKEQANSNYPYPINENANQRYNEVVRAHCNEFLKIEGGHASSVGSGVTVESGSITDQYENSEYYVYDQVIQKSFGLIMNDDSLSYLLNSIINIVINSQYVYYITNNSYMYKDRDIFYCTNIRYNINDQTYDVTDNININDIEYLRYNLYTEENDFVCERTDTRIHIDPSTVDNDNEKLIARALDSVGDMLNNNYDNVAIEYNKIYFFKNNDCDTSVKDIITVTKDCYIYDLITNSLILSDDGSNSYAQNIMYNNIEYLHNNIYDQNNNIIFNRKGYPRLFDGEKSITMYNADIGYSKYYSSDGTRDDKFDIPQQMRYNYDQIMLFADGYQIREFLVNDQLRLLGHIKTKENDIFICNMAKLILYQTIQDLTLYSNITIEVSNNFDNKVRYECDYHHRYRKNIDMVHYPLSLKYMMIFVNNIYMDEDHVEIISNRRFMLKNLDDYPEIKKKKMRDIYPDILTEDNNDEGYVINSLDIYMYPFALDKMYLDYYDNEIIYKDDYRNREYSEYPIKDDVYDKYMSELVSFPKRHTDTVIFEADNLKDPQDYYLSDFRYRALGKFTHNELARMRHDRVSDDRVMSNYTYDELSEFTHNELSYFIYENSEE